MFKPFGRSRVRMAALGLSVFALAACQDVTQADESVRDDTGNVVEQGDVGVFVMQIGDCFEGFDPGLVDSLTAIPCEDPHELEVFAKFEIAQDAYPGETVVDTEAEEGCIDRFEGYVGIDYLSSEYYVTFLTPTEEGWNAIDDREVVCLLSQNGTMSTGSGRDARI